MAEPHSLSTAQLDLEKRYDIYHCVQHEERVYENVKLVSIRTIDSKSYGSSYIEVETIFGSKMLLSSFGLHMICEHGTKPMFKVFRSWLSPSDGKSTLS